MKRGDVVTAAVPGAYGKPRPAVVIQSDLTDGTGSILVCLVTSTLRNAPAYRLDVGPGGETGLNLPSQVQVDKIMALPREKAGTVIGRLPDDTMAELGRRLAFMIGLGD